MNRQTRIVCGLSAASGAAALAHQIIWTRRLVDLLGADAFTFSKVIGAFFLGLAIGSALAAHLGKKSSWPWIWIATAECAVGLLALPALFSPCFGQFVYRHPWSGHFVPFILVMPPAVAMGLTTPFMIRANRGAAVTIYTANILGGLVGIPILLLYLFPRFGITNAGLIICLLNLFIAAFASGMHGLVKSRQDLQSLDVPAGAKQKIPFRRLLSFSSGFLVLALEVLLQHQFAQVTINSYFSSAIVLAWALLSLAAGSAITTKAARGADWAGRLPILLCCAAVCCVAQPFLFAMMRSGVEIIPYELRLPGYTFEVGKLALIALCPVFVAAGLIFPLLLDSSRHDHSAPSILAWNGLGGWLGSEISSGWLAPHFGLWQSMIVIAGAYALLAWVAAPKRVAQWLPLSMGAGLAMIGILASCLPEVSLGRRERLVEFKLGREGAVATVEVAPGDWRILYNNSYTLGGSKARCNQEREAHLPILLHGRAKSVGIMGIASAGTLAGAVLHSSLERIDAAELSPLILEQAQKHFAPFSRDVFQDPRVHLRIEDARWMAATQRDAYDVIIGDLFLPWRTGEGRLFTIDHFESVRRALKSDGLYCQWLPMFQLTQSQFDAIARSFQKVFPEAFLVRGDFYSDVPALGLVGGRSLSRLDWSEIKQACAELQKCVDVVDPLVRHAQGVAMMIVGALPEVPRGPLNTLANSWLEWDCSRNIVGLLQPWFVGVPEAQFLQSIHRRGQGSIPVDLRDAHEAGQFFLTLDIAAKLQLPELNNFIAQVPERLPMELRKDSKAVWKEWPTRLKPRLNPAPPAMTAQL